MSAFYGTPDESSAHATIDRALELGATFLDTADMYGWGDGVAVGDRYPNMSGVNI